MTDQTGTLDTKRDSPALGYLKWIQQAAAKGKGPGSLISELVKLMFGTVKLKPEEYFLYGLYDDERYTPEVKRTFKGINGPTVPSPWGEIAHDKLTLTTVLCGMGLPTPGIQAIVHKARSFNGAHSLRTRSDVETFLRTQADYPIFGKPFNSACSLGTANIRRYDADTDRLVLSSGQTMHVSALIDQIDELGWQYQFQTLLRPHPDLIPIIGDWVSTVRMFVLSDREGCTLLRASWKIPAPDNGADNFWRPGNMLAGIDVETGRIVKTLLRTADGIEPVSEHPVTKSGFEDLVFPHWDQMRQVVLQAAPNLPDCYFQGWDVALTDQGPVLVELEGDGGDPILGQLCFESGLYQGRYRTFVESAGEIEKQKQSQKKARSALRWKRNFAELKRSRQPDSTATAQIDPREVQSAFESAQDETSSTQAESVSAGV